MLNLAKYQRAGKRLINALASFVVKALKASTTKDTKVHKGCNSTGMDASAHTSLPYGRHGTPLLQFLERVAVLV